jgi:hypothetical protein
MEKDIKQGQVKVSLEGFGGKSLTAVLDRADVEGKDFREVVETMSLRQYTGRDKETLVAIQRQMSSSGGYRTHAGRGMPNRFEPVKLGDKVDPYIQKAPGLGHIEELRTAVLGSHILGQYQ